MNRRAAHFLTHYRQSLIAHSYDITSYVVLAVCYRNWLTSMIAQYDTIYDSTTVERSYYNMYIV